MRPAAPWIALLVIVTALSGCVDGGEDRREDPGDDDDPGMPPAPGPAVWGSVDAATIRPGASLGGYCTYNFLFTDDNATGYIGTAAHCTELGERVTLGADGPEIGTVVFDSDETAGADEAVDFSLIRLDPAQVTNAHPRMLSQTGPTGTIEAGEAAGGDRLVVYGYGVLLGGNEATRPREGVLVDEDGRLYRADMPAVNGDSGSPLLHVDSGKAFGIISHYGVGATPPSTDEGPIMPFIMEELADAGWTVTLALDA